MSTDTERRCQFCALSVSECDRLGCPDPAPEPSLGEPDPSVVSSEAADRLMERLDRAYLDCEDEALTRLLMDALLWVRKTAPAPVAG